MPDSSPRPPIYGLPTRQIGRLGYFLAECNLTGEQIEAALRLAIEAVVEEREAWRSRVRALDAAYETQSEKGEALMALADECGSTVRGRAIPPP